MDFLKRFSTGLGCTPQRRRWLHAASASDGAGAKALSAGGATSAMGAPSEEMLYCRIRYGDRCSVSHTWPILPRILDPLGGQPPGDPSLDPANYGLTPALQAAVPASVLRVKVPGATLAEVLPRTLQQTYSSTIAYEVEHISNTQQREWLRDYIESGKHTVVLSQERQIEFLQRLTRVDSFDRYLRKTFLGQKTFSGEGLDAMVPMLERSG